MKQFLCTLLLLANSFTFNYEVKVGRQASFNEEWLFHMGEVEDGYNLEYDDSSWTKVDLPHDYQLNLDYSSQGEAESGYKLSEVSWYRKHFEVSQELDNKKIVVSFDGIYMNPSIYINGEYLGYQPYGYAPFSFDLTDYINYGEDNVLAIRVDNKFPNSRWYSGAGIIRNVQLDILNRTYINKNSLNAAWDKDNQTLDVSFDIHNESESNQDISYVVQLLDETGNIKSESEEITKEIKDDSKALESLTLETSDITLWSIDNPYLYTIKILLKNDNKVVDELETLYGFRDVSFDNENGLSLNGEPIRLKGVCLHHDNGSLGASENRVAIQRKLSKLKLMGANAIRTAHNPASKVFMEECAKMGFLVIEEFFDTWLYPKNGNTYDFSYWFNLSLGEDNKILNDSNAQTWAQYVIYSTIERDRNNPSLLAYSIGNEILGNTDGNFSIYPQIAQDLCMWVEDKDPNRPITIGDNLMSKYFDIHQEIDEVIHQHNGWVGFNYADESEYDNMRHNHPDWIMYGSETSSAPRTRNWYTTKSIDNTNHQISSYDEYYSEWGSSASSSWQSILDRNYLLGEFIWTGFDYLGEPEPWNGFGSGQEVGPRSSYYGILDTAGFEKDIYYFYQSQWNDEVSTLHILPVWNEEDVLVSEGNVDVVVYSDANSVELFLNDESLGRQYLEEGKLSFNWSVPYVPGTLKAIGYDENDNQLVDTYGISEISTTNEERVLNITVENKELYANKDELIYVNIESTDSNGNRVLSNDELYMTVIGSGVIKAIDNGNPNELRSFLPNTSTTTTYPLFQGKCLLIIKPDNKPGDIVITVSGLNTQTSQTITTIPKPEKTSTLIEDVNMVTTAERPIIGYVILGVIVLLVMFILRKIFKRHK